MARYTVRKQNSKAGVKALLDTDRWDDAVRLAEQLHAAGGGRHEVHDVKLTGRPAYQSAGHL